MRKASTFKNSKNQAIRLPSSLAYEGVEELSTRGESGLMTLYPIRPSWQSLATLPAADADFLQARPDVIADECRFAL